MVFADRKEAGAILARLIEERFKGDLKEPILVAIPRGGVVVAEKIAESLGAPVEIVVPRKIGAPFNSEFAIGPVAEDGEVFLNPYITPSLAKGEGITDEYVKKKAEEELKEARRRREKYRKGKKVSLSGRDVILVDDGIATGLTVKAGIHSVRAEKPNRIILAVPVLPADKLPEFERLVDAVVTACTPEHFSAVSQFYEDFSQTTDEEVVEILQRHGA